MAASILDRVTSALFGSSRSVEAPDAELIGEVTELVVETVEPKIRYQSRYKKRLAPSITSTIRHLQMLARSGLDAVTLTKAAWSTDPRVNAFFATADDVLVCLGNSQELRQFFEANTAGDEAFALLAMKKEERQVFAPDTSGERIVKDVAKVSVCFSEHRVIAPSPTYADTRLTVGKRIIERLAEVALALITEASETPSELQARKAHLAARLRQLELAQRGVAGHTSDVASRIAEVKQQLAGVAEQYGEARKGDAGSLASYIRVVDDVLSHPEQHVSTVLTPLRLD